MKIVNAIAMTAAVVLVTAAPAYPQRDVIQLQADVVKLQNQVNQLQNDVDDKTNRIQGLVEKMFDQINGLTASMQKMSQTIDALSAHEDKSAAELRATMSATNSKITDLSDAVTALKSQLSSVSDQITAAKTTTQSLPTSKEALGTAETDALSGRYDLAISEFNDVIAKYPDDSGALEAQYEIGKVYYEEKKYDQAATQFDVFLQKGPENDRTKDALLYKGLALLFSTPSQRLQAIKVLQQVISKYPNTVQASNAQEQLRKLGVKTP